jgi:hypothetical protein
MQHGEWGAQLMAGVGDEPPLQGKSITKWSHRTPSTEIPDRTGNDDADRAGDQQRITNQVIIIATWFRTGVTTIAVPMQQGEREHRDDRDTQCARQRDLDADPAGSRIHQLIVSVGRSPEPRPAHQLPIR